MKTPDSLLHILSLGFALLVMWLLLSGLYYPMFILFGVAAAVLVVWISARMDVADQEGHPIHLWWRVFIYWPWLMKEMFVSCVDVSRRVLSPSLPISPCVFEVEAKQETALGKTIFANSITLTPGTVSMSIDGNRILVHALSEEARDVVLGGEMNERARRFEGHSRPEGRSHGGAP